jgi:prepilin peptidase dependent protein B
MLARRMQQHGLSLIELMITMAIGLMMMAALSAVFANTIGVNSRSLQLSQLQEESTVVMELMASDLRRAGFRANAHLVVVDPDNASTDFNDSVVVSHHPDEAPQSCVLFRYDANQNGSFDGSAELFGYRLRSGQVQRRQDAADCGSAGWQALTSADMVAVESLTFTLTERSSGTLLEQIITLALTTANPTDDTLKRQLATEVVVRNAF